MKFTLTLYICSLIAEQCYIPVAYPKVKQSYYNCVRDGLGESYEYLFAENNFTEKRINDSQVYATYTCLPTEEEKI
jgi:hypothetical protein